MNNPLPGKSIISCTSTVAKVVILQNDQGSRKLIRVGIIY